MALMTSALVGDEVCFGRWVSGFDEVCFGRWVSGLDEVCFGRWVSGLDEVCFGRWVSALMALMMSALVGGLVLFCWWYVNNFYRRRSIQYPMKVFHPILPLPYLARYNLDFFVLH
jgi:hypothetical protein